MNIRDLQQDAHRMSRDKGWYDGFANYGDDLNMRQPERNIPEMLALIHSEVSEALEAWRENNVDMYYSESGKPEGLVVELADTMIRIADLAGYMDIDLSAAIATKIAYNATRPYRHGGKSA